MHEERPLCFYQTLQQDVLATYLGLSVREQINYEGMRNQHPPRKIALQHKMSA